MSITWPSQTKTWLLTLYLHTPYTPSEIAAILSLKFDIDVSADEAKAKYEYWSVSRDRDFTMIACSDQKERAVQNVVVEAGMGLEMLREEERV
ncbi:MAG: hypothetical protein LQ338_006856 [Usnochroma carphineum]|nr:MAG: hypothetical protein LQ338_006856 [Usnochroma carphineum]